MASDTEIANLALLHLGHSKEIGNLETEKSDEANVLRRLFPTVRDAVLRDFCWPFATTRVTLALVQTNTSGEWAYYYRYPSDCIFFRRILSGSRNDTRESRIPFREARDAAGLLIYTDVQQAVGEYTIRETDVQRFASDFVIALSWRLAAYAAPKITAGDPFKLGVRALQMYAMELSRAQANAANEEQRDPEPESPSVVARG